MSIKMTVCINANLKTPYEIGRYIVSLVPPFSNLTSKTAAVHDFSLHPGPDPTFQQMSQGLILEVGNLSHKPLALLTKYGRWEILGTSRGNFLDIFNNSIREQLRLRKMCDAPQYYISYWAIQTWNGKLLPEPRKTERNSYVSLDQAHIALQDFISDLSIISEKTLPPQLRQPTKNTPVAVHPPSTKVSPLTSPLRNRTDTQTLGGWNPLFDSPLIMKEYSLDNNPLELENLWDT
ncbi:MAG TPA: hypothetical protein VGO47_11420 [Chlamydiales bacterium]|jgi:hypothetical protein|nr:hypothetical protein [Chlamydiales bacterium]